MFKNTLLFILFFQLSNSVFSQEIIQGAERVDYYFNKLNDIGVNVILSNSSSPFIKEIYNEFNIVEIFCRRNINSKSDKRGKIPEFLVIGDKILNQ